jgi:hypothetical protein
MTRFDINPYLWHFQITKLVPEILDGVQTDQCSDEETDPFHTANAANRYAKKHQPQAPFRREWIPLLTMKFGPTEDGGEGKA